MLWVALLLAVAGCDAGDPDRQPYLGPPLQILATYPEDGAGLDCASSDVECGVPIDTTIEVRFDRFLLPSTAVRQSILFYSGRALNPPVSGIIPEIVPAYDPLERVVRYTQAILRW